MTSLFPELPIEKWEPTKETLHRYLQILGKIKLELMPLPYQNHWWHIKLYINSRGFSTDSIPYGGFVFDISIDCILHEVIVRSSTGFEKRFGLSDGLSVAEFYKKLFDILEKINLSVDILAEPYDLPDATPFSECYHHDSYDTSYVARFWNIMLQVDTIFKEFSGRSYSKTCPMHIYWHHMDLAVTRFSGERGPDMPDASNADKEAYSHEVISFGFRAGDKNVRHPAFYSYTYPSPKHLNRGPLLPESAKWIDSNGSPVAFLNYDDIRHLDNPKEAILKFLESSYQAGAKSAG